MDDLISRKAMREAMYHEAMEKDSDEQKWDGGCWIRYKMFERVIESLPSAEPVIRCKDCVRHNVSVEDWYDNHELKVCPLVGHRGKAIGHEFDYQFCAYAERKE